MGQYCCRSVHIRHHRDNSEGEYLTRQQRDSFRSYSSSEAVVPAQASSNSSSSSLSAQQYRPLGRFTFTQREQQHFNHWWHNTIKTDKKEKNAKVFLNDFKNVLDFPSRLTNGLFRLLPDPFEKSDLESLLFYGLNLDERRKSYQKNQPDSFFTINYKFHFSLWNSNQLFNSELQDISSADTHAMVAELYNVITGNAAPSSFALAIPSDGMSFEEWRKWIDSSLQYLLILVVELFYNRFFSVGLDTYAVSFRSIRSTDSNMSHYTPNPLSSFHQWLLSIHLKTKDLDMNLLYSTATHGFSMTQFAANAINYPSRTLLIVKTATAIADASGQVKEQPLLFGVYMFQRWKSQKRTFITDPSSFIIIFEPVFEICPTAPASSNHLHFNETTGIGFGGKIGLYRLFIDSFMQEGSIVASSTELLVFQPSNSGYRTSASNSVPIGPSYQSLTHIPSCRFYIDALYLYGLGGKAAVKDWKYEKEFDKKFAESRNSLSSSADKQILEWGGVHSFANVNV